MINLRNEHTHISFTHFEPPPSPLKPRLPWISPALTRCRPTSPRWSPTSNVPLLILICWSVPNDCCVVFCVLSMRCNCTQLNMQQLSQVKVVQADEWYVGQLSRALGEKGFAASQASRFLNPLATWQLGNLTTSQAALNDTTLLPADNAFCFIACHTWKQSPKIYWLGSVPEQAITYFGSTWGLQKSC